jgi:hypothetical protein
LNHADTDITGRVYDQHDYYPEMRLALTTWADELRSIIANTKRKVVPLRSGKRARK